MRIIRKQFNYPSGRKVKKKIEVKSGFFFWSKGDVKEVELHEDYTFEEVVRSVQDFVATIPAQNLISVLEYTEPRYRLGDDESHRFVVWYREV